jgi:hypothetical protein
MNAERGKHSCELIGACSTNRTALIALMGNLLPKCKICFAMGWLVISRAECSAISARRRTTAHFTVVSTVLCTGYYVNKTVSCVLMNEILMTII